MMRMLVTVCVCVCVIVVVVVTFLQHPYENIVTLMGHNCNNLEAHLETLLSHSHNIRPSEG
jgi:preprotein translocase subunit SecG